MTEVILLLWWWLFLHLVYVATPYIVDAFDKNLRI